MKKILALGMLGLMIAAAFALGTSATFGDFEATRSAHIAVVADDEELIDLTPVQPYAYITNGGQLVIDLSSHNGNWNSNPGEGVSPNSTYVFEEVFGISNDLWEGTSICTRITYSGSGGILFFEGDYVRQVQPPLT